MPNKEHRGLSLWGRGPTRMLKAGTPNAPTETWTDHFCVKKGKKKKKTRHDKVGKIEEKYCREEEKYNIYFPWQKVEVQKSECFARSTVFGLM